MKILVTGGTGFIGHVLIDRLLKQGAEVRSTTRENNSELDARVEWMVGDLTDPDFCRKICTGIDELFHLASHRKNVAYHREHVEEVKEENLAMTRSLIAAIDRPIPVTFMSTANIPEHTPELSQDGYVAGKAIAEDAWLAAAHERGFPILIVRPVGVYGPGDRFGRDANVIPSLIVKASEDDQLEVWGDGSQQRCFVYVDDVVDATLKLRSDGIQSVQSIAPEQIVTVKELSEMIRDLVKPELPIQFDPSKPGGSLPAIPPPHPSLQNFHWTPLKAGLQKTVDSFRLLP